MSLDSHEISDRLQEFVELSNDGYAIFDQNDRLLYANPSFKTLMNVPNSPDCEVTMASLLKENFKQNRGIRIDSGDVDAFIDYARNVRRSRDFRLFEVDFVDGRWFLFSEQLNANKEMLMQITDITKQKVVQENLQASLNDLKSVALTDELTKVGNRRALVESVKNELSRCRRTGVSMTMLLVDLDFFKSVNDTYGHQVGDEALKHVASLIKQSLRPYDILGRIGGEEFAVFLSNTTSDEGEHIANRTRLSVASSPFKAGDKEINLTVSIGMTTLGCDAVFEDLYEQADEALYLAKKNGRNRVCKYASVKSAPSEPKKGHAN